MMHRDSLGSVQQIEPGAINWMTAGRGIVHSERKPDAPARQPATSTTACSCGRRCRRRIEEAEPCFAHTPRRRIPAARGAGRCAGARAGRRGLRPGARRSRPSSPTLYLDVRLPAGGVLRAAGAGARAGGLPGRWATCRSTATPLRAAHDGRAAGPAAGAALQPRPPVRAGGDRRRRRSTARATCGGTSSPAARSASCRPATTGRRSAWARCRARRVHPAAGRRASRRRSLFPRRRGRRSQRLALVEHEAVAAEVRAADLLEVLEDAAFELPARARSPASRIRSPPSRSGCRRCRSSRRSCRPARRGAPAGPAGNSLNLPMRQSMAPSKRAVVDLEGVARVEQSRPAGRRRHGPGRASA